LRKPSIGPKVIGSSDQTCRLRCNLGSGDHSRRSLDHREHRLGDSLANAMHEMRRDRARQHREVRFRPAHGIEVQRMPLGPNAVHSDGDRHSPFRRNRRDSSRASIILVFGFHGIFEVEHDEIGRRLPRLGDGARVGRRQEQHRPHGEQVDASVVFSFRSVHHRRIMPEIRNSGEDRC
jgi:hypothetical protein